MRGNLIINWLVRMQNIVPKTMMHLHLLYPFHLPSYFWIISLFTMGVNLYTFVGVRTPTMLKWASTMVLWAPTKNYQGTHNGFTAWAPTKVKSIVVPKRYQN